MIPSGNSSNDFNVGPFDSHGQELTNLDLIELETMQKAEERAADEPISIKKLQTKLLTEDYFL